MIKLVRDYSRSLRYIRIGQSVWARKAGLWKRCVGSSPTVKKNEAHGQKFIRLTREEIGAFGVAFSIASLSVIWYFGSAEKKEETRVTTEKLAISILKDLATDTDSGKAIVENHGMKILLQYAQDINMCNDEILRGIGRLAKVPEAQNDFLAMAFVPQALYNLQECCSNTENKHIKDMDNIGTLLRNLATEKKNSNVLQVDVGDYAQTSNALRHLKKIVLQERLPHFQLYSLWAIERIVTQLMAKTTHARDLLPLLIKPQLLVRSIDDIQLEIYSARLVKVLIQACNSTKFSPGEEVVTAWMKQITRWLSSDLPSLQLEAVHCLAILSKCKEYTSHIVTALPELLIFARSLHSLGQLTESKCHATLTELRRHIVQVLANVSQDACQGSNGGHGPPYPFDQHSLTNVQSPTSLLFAHTHDIADMSMIEAATWDETKDVGWVDLLSYWSTLPEIDIRRDALRTLSHLVRFGAYTHLVLQAWLMDTLRSIQASHPTEEDIRRAVRGIEILAQMQPDGSPAQESVKVHADILEVGCAALAILAQRHSTEFYWKGGLELVLLLALHGESYVQSECARVIANLAAQSCRHWDDDDDDDDELGRCDGFEKVDLADRIAHTHGGVEFLKLIHNWSNEANINVRANFLRAKTNLASYSARLLHQDVAYEPCPYYVEGTNIMDDVTRLLPDVDVVLVHGLRGHPFATWRAGFTKHAKFMPDIWPNTWLTKDLLRAGYTPRLVTLGYEAGMVTWSSPWQALSLHERASLMLESLFAAHVGMGSSGSKRPVVFITHSLGGLLVKEMLTLASKNPVYRSLFDNTSGVVFIAVPHFGGNVGKRTNAETIRSLLQAHPATKDLARNEPHLVGMNQEFANYQHFPCLSLGEEKPMDIGLTLKRIIVSPESADPKFGEYHLLKGTSHMDICKPENEADERYALIRDFLLRSLKKIPKN